MKALPETVRPYHRTPVFTEVSIPAALLGDHITKTGVWGVITVLSGRLEYCIATTGETVVLDADRSGIVEPQVAHRINPLGAVSFFIEFHR